MQIADIDAQQRYRITVSQVYDRVIAHLIGDALHIFEVAGCGCSRQVDGVVCGGPDREVGDRVVVAAVSEDEQVISCRARQDVITAAAIYDVVAGAAFESVTPVTAGENVIVIPADKNIVAIRTRELCRY